MNEMLEAKKRLYGLILAKEDKATESELLIACNLAGDKEIQKYLDKCFNKGKSK